MAQFSSACRPSVYCRLLLLLMFPAVFVRGQQKLTNIDFLGLGYDVYHGNPHADLHDPGFRDPVFRLDYSDQSTTSDGYWLVPDNVLALQTFGCGYETETTEIHGTTSYVDSLSKDAKHSYNGIFFSFSASSSYREVHSGTSMYRRSYVSSIARCLIYHASFKRLADVRVTDQFRRAVEALPTSRNDDRYVAFATAFGTHYAGSLGMGSKAVVRSEFAESAWTKLDSVKYNYQKASHASFLAFAGGSASSTSTDKELAQSFDGNRTSVSASYMGCRPSSDGKWETWMDSTGVSPYPISYEIWPITDLLTERYFPNASADALAARRTLLNASYAVYCARSPGCGPPEPDRVPVRMDRPDSAIIGTQRTSCRNGTALLSCGLGNLTFPTSDESKRCAVPVDEKTCECFADNGAVCRPWCSNAVRGFERQASGFTKGESGIQCPKNKKVWVVLC